MILVSKPDLKILIIVFWYFLVQLGFSCVAQGVKFNTDLFSDSAKYSYTEKWLDAILD